MFDSIVDNKCWINLSNQFGITDHNKRKEFLNFVIVVLILFIIYFYYDEIKKITRNICKTINVPIDIVKGVEDVFVDSFSSTSILSH
jgi:hypothetical protein